MMSADVCPDVCVLLSTFNGEKYLREQLESLIAQEDVDVKIIVRDDGSSDRTKELLQEYQECGKLTWYAGDNLKPAMSFMDLVYNAPEAHYYAFCDQDDIWLPNKLSKAIKKMSQVNSTGSILYYGQPRIVDKNLVEIKKEEIARGVDYAPSLAESFLESNAIGCTFVMNQELIQNMKKYRPYFVPMHDAWAQKVCLVLDGEVIFDNDVPILYRQHGNNVVGGLQNPRERWLRRIRAFLNKERTRSRLALELLEMFGDIMGDDIYEQLYMAAHYRDNLKLRLKLLSNKNFRTDAIGRNCVFMLAVLMGAF